MQRAGDGLASLKEKDTWRQWAKKCQESSEPVAEDSEGMSYGYGSEEGQTSADPPPAPEAGRRGGLRDAVFELYSRKEALPKQAFVDLFAKTVAPPVLSVAEDAWHLTSVTRQYSSPEPGRSDVLDKLAAILTDSFSLLKIPAHQSALDAVYHSLDAVQDEQDTLFKELESASALDSPCAGTPLSPPAERDPKKRGECRPAARPTPRADTPPSRPTCAAAADDLPPRAHSFVVLPVSAGAGPPPCPGGRSAAAKPPAGRREAAEVYSVSGWSPKVEGSQDEGLLLLGGGGVDGVDASGFAGLSESRNFDFLQDPAADEAMSRRTDSNNRAAGVARRWACPQLQSRTASTLVAASDYAPRLELDGSTRSPTKSDFPVTEGSCSHNRPVSPGGYAPGVQAWMQPRTGTPSTFESSARCTPPSHDHRSSTGGSSTLSPSGPSADALRDIAAAERARDLVESTARQQQVLEKLAKCHQHAFRSLEASRREHAACVRNLEAVIESNRASAQQRQDALQQERERLQAFTQNGTQKADEKEFSVRQKLQTVRSRQDELKVELEQLRLKESELVSQLGDIDGLRDHIRSATETVAEVIRTKSSECEKQLNQCAVESDNLSKVSAFVRSIHDMATEAAQHAADANSDKMRFWSQRLLTFSDLCVRKCSEVAASRLRQIK
eukprot:gene12849-19805_t